MKALLLVLTLGALARCGPSTSYDPGIEPVAVVDAGVDGGFDSYATRPPPGIPVVVADGGRL